jgi:hypothetical protein
VAPVAIIENRMDNQANDYRWRFRQLHVTSHFPLPYRVIMSGVVTPHEINNMANARAPVGVRGLHLLGFW